MSMFQGFSPNVWQVTKLKPINRKGKKKDPSNDQPISLLSKIYTNIKCVVHDKANAFLLENHALCTH